MHLFEPLALRDVRLRNRIVVSPMCEYSSEDGFANAWHLVHLGSRAVGGAALVFTEATAVEATGRISPQDLGIYHDAHIEKLAEIVRFVEGQGAVAGMQLAHAGRKASTGRPWEGGRPLDPQHGGWTRLDAPSALAFDEGYQVPHAMESGDLARVTAAFVDGARRAQVAGFRVLEIHAAHGYLLHSFLSPLSNQRTDAYGGSFENRTRLLREIVAAVRTVWPQNLPLFARISATDWVAGGWTLDDSVVLARELGSLGVDVIDCSSGGNVPRVRIPIGPGYQVPFAERVRREGTIATGAVGMIVDPHQAEAIVRDGQADVVLLARELLRDPYWPLRAATVLGVEGPWPPQYLRAKPQPI